MKRAMQSSLYFFLSLFALPCAAGEAPQPVPDAIYFNGKVVTMDAAASSQEAFAVRGDRFVAVGNSAALRLLAGPRTRLVDLRGATVIPGLSDNHDHLWNAGRYLYRGVDLIGVTSRPEVEQRLRDAVGKAGRREVVFTTLGWTLQPAPTRQELDAISATVPIVMIASRRGIGYFNSAALARLGISKANPVFQGVKVPVDAAGEPLGTPPPYPWGVTMIDSLLPPLTPRLQEEMVVKAMAQRNALGITSIRELAVWPDAVAGLQRLRRAGKLTVRMALGLEFPDQAATAQHLAKLPAVKRDDPWLFLDSVGEEPWTPATATVEAFTSLVREENRLGWRPAPHVNADVLRGVSADDALDRTLQAYEAVDRESPLNGKRWYIEHAPLATPADMERMARMGLVLSTQDPGYRGVPSVALPAARLEHYNPTRGFLEHKLIVIGGSDYNGPSAVERDPNNPLIPFYFYVTRKTATGTSTTGAERISREEALRIFTTNPAYATFQEKVRGQIASGMLADFVVLNQDLMSVPDEQILATHALATFVGGRKMYSAPGSPY
jgi:predicted amidohydrolase YtcJ